MSRATAASSAAQESLQAEADGDPALVHDAAGAQRRVLAVVDDRQADDGAVLERAAHHAGVRQRAAVVAEGDGAGLGHVRQLGKLLAVAAGRDAPMGSTRTAASSAALRSRASTTSRGYR